MSYHVPKKIDVDGARANGTPYVRVAASGREAWIPRAAFMGSGAEARTMLRDAGIPMLKNEWRKCAEQVERLDEFPEKPLIENPGWDAAGHFVLPDGTPFASEGDEIVVLFPGDPDKCAKTGTIAKWLRLTDLLEGQHLASFVLFASFAAPLLRFTKLLHNPGFELAGPGGVGKSTMQRVAAAVCGAADSAVGANYQVTANATVNGLEQVMAQHADSPLIIEEANLFASQDPSSRRADKWNGLIFSLAEGTSKLRFGGPRPRRRRLVFLISTNEALRDLLASRPGAASDAAADRLLTIPISADRPYGIFDFLPDAFEDIGELADALNTGVRQVHGVALRRFIKCLVRERAARPRKLQSRIRQLMKEFRAEVQVRANDGSATRVADSFGLVSAAAVLAIEWGAVSAKLDPMAAARACYALHLGTRQPVDRVQELLRLATDFDSIEVHPGALREMPDCDVEDAPAIVRHLRSGRVEVLLTDAQLRRAFPERRRFLDDPQVRRILIADANHLTTKRRFRANRKAERVFCFAIPDQLARERGLAQSS